MIYFPDQHMILTNSSKSIVPDESMSICKREYQNKEKILSNLINLTFEKSDEAFVYFDLSDASGSVNNKRDSPLP